MSNWIDAKTAEPADGKMVWVHLHRDAYEDTWDGEHKEALDEVLLAKVHIAGPAGIVWSINDPEDNLDFDIHGVKYRWAWGEITEVVEWMPVVRPKLE